MAGRYIILEFEDRDEASAFVQMSHLQEQLHFKPMAMFLKPKICCQCPDKNRQQLNNWRKHPKYGLYICTKCKRPSKFHEGGLIKRLQYAFGYNLLEG